MTNIYHFPLRESAIHPDNCVPSPLPPMNREILLYKYPHISQPIPITIGDLLNDEIILSAQQSKVKWEVCVFMCKY